MAKVGSDGADREGGLPWRASWLVLLVAAALCSLAACSTESRPAEPASIDEDVGRVVALDGKERVIPVADGVEVRVPAGAFEGAGTFASDASAQSAPEVPAFTPVTPVLDLAVTGDLRAPLTVTFDPGPRKESVPVILHFADDTGWEVVAVGEEHGSAVLETTSFSPHLFGFISVPGWLQRGADSVSGAVRTAFNKRSDPPSCPDAAPPWVDFSPAPIDAILSCATTNTDESTGLQRGEIRLVNNRGYPIEVGVPERADWAWVNGQPDAIREAVRAVARRDAVWLLPGQLMTVGLSQPEKGEVVGIPARISAQTVLVGFLQDALAKDLGPLGVVHVLSECTAWADLPLDVNPLSPQLKSVFTAAKNCFGALAADPVRRLVIADAVSGGKASAEKVSRVAGALKTAAAAIAVVDNGADIIDMLADGYVNPGDMGGGVDGFTTTIGLRARQRPQPAPVTVAPCSETAFESLLPSGMSMVGEEDIYECDGRFAVVLGGDENVSHFYFFFADGGTWRRPVQCGDRSVPGATSAQYCNAG